MSGAAVAALGAGRIALRALVLAGVRLQEEEEEEAAAARGRAGPGPGSGGSGG